MQKLNINLDKIPDEAIFQGRKGRYITLVLHDNRDGKDQYDQDGFAALDVTKEEREANVKGAIVGNWKYIGTGAPKTGTLTGRTGTPTGGPSSRPASRQSAPLARQPVKPPVDPDLDADDDSDQIPFN